VELEVLREEFESLIAPRIERTIELCQQVVETHIGPGRIDEILLVGGSSRIPMVRRRLEETFGNKPILFEPELAIAIGAALHARAQSATSARPDGEARQTVMAASNTLMKPISIALADTQRVIAPEGTPLPHTVRIPGVKVGSRGPMRVCLFEAQQPLGEIEIQDLQGSVPVGGEVDLVLTIHEDYRIEGQAQGRQAAAESHMTTRTHEIVAGPECRHYAASPRAEEEGRGKSRACQEALARAREAAQRQDWDAAVGSLRRLLASTGGVEQAEVRKNLAACLLNRAVDKANQAAKAMGDRTADSHSLRRLISEMNACERDALEAARLEPSGRYATDPLGEIRSVTAKLELRCFDIDASAAANRGDWDHAVDCLRKGAAAAGGSDKKTFEKNLAVCLANRAISGVNQAMKTPSPAEPGSSLAAAIKGAERDLNEALVLDPTNDQVRSQLGQIRNRLAMAPVGQAAPESAGSRGWLGRFRGRRPAKPEAARAGAPSAAKPETPAQRPSARRGTPEVPGGAVDRVHFSLTAPPAVLPETAFVLNVWAHLEQQRIEVIKRAREAAGGGEIYIQSKGPIRVARGTILTVHLRLDELIVNDSDDTIFWEGDIGNATFAVIVPKDVTHGTKQGIAAIYVDGLQIAKINFVIQVCARASTADRLEVREARHRKAFASYASADRDEVLARIQGILKAAPDMDVFVDILKLRSGQDWEQNLWREIPSSDVFYLFWSRSAKESRWVEKEWRCALEAKGPDFIDPVPLVSPDEVSPPAELAGKHFNDWTLAFMRGRRSGA
jgi:hypothetical protein